MRAYHICYHTDEDGLASASVIYEYLKRINKNNNVLYFFYKIDYTVDLSTILSENIPEGDEIYFVDYSFSKKSNLEYVLKFSSKGITVRWIDHHKTSLNIITGREYEDIDINLYKNFYYYIDTDYCGAYLAYVYAYLKIKSLQTTVEFPDILMGTIDKSMHPKYIPLYIKYVDSWDTWKHNISDTTEFNIGIGSIKRTPKSALSSIFKYNNKIINKLFSDDKKDIEIIESYMKRYINDTIAKGKIIKEYKDIENESICENAGFEFSILDHTTCRHYNCFAVNSRGNSTVAGYRINKYDIIVLFRFNGEQYTYSLYTNRDAVDCCLLAKKLGSYDKLGGGGHAKAAGFQTRNQILKTKCLIVIRNKLFTKNKYNILIT